MGTGRAGCDASVVGQAAGSGHLRRGLIELAETVRTGILSPPVLEMRRLVTTEALSQPEVARVYLEESWNTNIHNLGGTPRVSGDSTIWIPEDQPRAHVMSARLARSRLVPADLTSPALWVETPNAVMLVTSQCAGTLNSPAMPLRSKARNWWASSPR